MPKPEARSKMANKNEIAVAEVLQLSLLAMRLGRYMVDIIDLNDETITPEIREQIVAEADEVNQRYTSLLEGMRQQTRPQ